MSEEQNSPPPVVPEPGSEPPWWQINSKSESKTAQTFPFTAPGWEGEAEGLQMTATHECAALDGGVVEVALTGLGGEWMAVLKGGRDIMSDARYCPFCGCTIPLRAMGAVLRRSVASYFHEGVVKGLEGLERFLVGLESPEDAEEGTCGGGGGGL